MTNGGPPVWAPPQDTVDLSMSSHWYRDRSRLAIDLLVAALACGVTRSGVLQYDQAASNAHAVGQSLDHHNTSHQEPQLEEFIERLPVMPPDYQQVCVDYQSAWDQLSVWENYYAEEFAYLLSQLQSHGVLDDTLVLWGSEIDSGAGHMHYNMPFVLAAGPNIPIQRGTVARFPINYAQSDNCIPTDGMSPSHNAMLRTTLKAVGVDVASVGSATGLDLNSKQNIPIGQDLLTAMLTTTT